MRFSVFDLKMAVLGVALLATALAPAARAQAPESTAATAAPEVTLRFTAFDGRDNHVTTLGPEDIKLTVGGKPQAVTSLRRQEGGPLSLVVAVDASASQERVLGGAKLAAEAFVQSVVSQGGGEAGVVSFAREATLEQAPTGEVARLREAIGRIKFTPPPGSVSGGYVVVPHGTPPPRRAPRAGSTAVWDAVAFASEKVLAPRAAAARRALILFTDGVDTSSRLKLEEAARRALRERVVVYAVGIGDSKAFDGVDERALRKLTERTGGRAFFPERPEELPAVFAQIQAGLVSPYVLTFGEPEPRRGGQFREVKLEIADPELRRRGVELSYPRGYFAR